MASYTVKSFDQILSDMIAWIVSNSTTITDLNPGSVIRSFCEGTALSIEEVYIATYLGFRRYLNRIPETVFDFERKGGTKASANVVFTRSGSSGVTTIPANTRVETATGLRYILSAETEITDGNTDSAASEVIADEVGTSYNVAGSTITVLVDSIEGVVSVTNALAATGGVNKESDIEYKRRFNTYIEGLGRSNVAGLIAGALSVEGITSVSLVELFPPVANVNVDLYIDDGSGGGVSSTQIAEVQSIIDGDGTESNPGYRAAGVNVVVQSPSIVSQDIEVTITALSGVDTDQIRNDIDTAITGYVNTLGIGEDIVYNELVRAIMAVYGVSDCSLTTPSSNVSITDTQVGRVGTITVTIV